MSRTQPNKGQVYTTLQIDNELELRDSPSLCFYNEHNENDVVQDSHLAVNISTLPGWAELRWTFVRETHEWIPIFQIFKEDTEKLMSLLSVDVESLDDVDLWNPIIPSGYDASGRPIAEWADTAEVKEYAPKKYRMTDVKGQGTALDYSGEFTLRNLVSATDWSDEEFDKITDLTVGQTMEFDNGHLTVTRVS